MSLQHVCFHPPSLLPLFTHSCRTPPDILPRSRLLGKPCFLFFSPQSVFSYLPLPEPEPQPLSTPPTSTLQKNNNPSFREQCKYPVTWKSVPYFPLGSLRCRKNAGRELNWCRKLFRRNAYDYSCNASLLHLSRWIQRTSFICLRFHRNTIQGAVMVFVFLFFFFLLQSPLASAYKDTIVCRAWMMPRLAGWIPLSVNTHWAALCSAPFRTASPATKRACRRSRSEVRAVPKWNVRRWAGAAYSNKRWFQEVIWASKWTL